MAEEPKTNGESHKHAHSPTSTCATCNKDHQHADAPDAQPVENTFQLTIKLPHHPYKTQTIVSTQDQAQDIRQSIIDLPHTFQYSCFHLERNGERIPDFVDLAEIPGISADVELTLVEDPYTEKDARLHFLRIRDLIGASGDRTDLSQGIQAGLSLHDDIFGTGEAAVQTNGEAKSGDSHPMSGYDLDTPAPLDALLQTTQEAAPKTIKAVSLSPWNPPPYHLRSKGHLLYLQITTNEGEQHQVTSHVTGFYVNKSSNSKFDPFPRNAPKSVKAHSLLVLLSRISPSFDASFKALQEHNSKRDQLALFQPSNATPANPWLVPLLTGQLAAHISDVARSQESYLISGADNAESLRDWNEEFQTLKELPRESVQDRVFRERATSKLFADYNEAATAGAVLIARGEVAPLNPTENSDAQIFVYNNVFYSFGADGVGTFTNEGGDEAARVATGKDVAGVRTVNQLDIQGLSSPGTVVVDYLGKRLVGQSIVPGIFRQREPGDAQIDYGGVEGKDIVAEDVSFHPLFEKLAKAMRTKKHSVWDKAGKKHELETSVETKGLIGTDARKYALDLYRLTPLDVSWIESHWTGLPEQGAEDKHDGYIHRMTVLRPELVDGFWRTQLRTYINEQIANKKPLQLNGGSQHENATIEDSSKAEVTNGHVDEKKEDDLEGRKPEAEKAQERVDVSEFSYSLNPDVFSGQQPQTDEEKAEWAKDEAEVREACDFLHKQVIPRLISDLQDGDVGFPMDGQSLSTLLHKRGINIRYLGKIAELSNSDDARLRALQVLTLQEMISRSFKHLANKHLKELPSSFATACISHLLNCLLGAGLNSNPVAVIDEELQSMYSEVEFSFRKVTPDSLQADVARQVRLRYRYDLPSSWTHEIKHIQLLREVALKLGLQIGAKEFVFADLPKHLVINGAKEHSNGLQIPTTNDQASSGGKKKKKGGDRSPSRAPASPPSYPQQTFYPDDIYNIVPILKESSPRSVLADEALEAGRLSIVQNQRELGTELLLESLSLHEQIYGVLHPEVARVYHTLSTLFYSLDDRPIAVELARKAVIVSERVLGVDSNETLLAYLNLGLFEHSAGNSRLALLYFRHALDLSKIVYGSHHPDAITTLNNAAVMLQSLKLFPASRHWFETCLNLCERFSGPSSVHTATVLFQLAQALALDHDPKAAVARMREAYTIFNTKLGPEDRNTKEAETWLEQLTQNAVSIARHAKDVQMRRMRRLQQTAPGQANRVVLQRQVGQTSGDAASGGLGASASSAAGLPGIMDMHAASQQALRTIEQQTKGMDERSIDDLLRYINEGGEAGKGTPRMKKTPNPKRRR